MFSVIFPGQGSQKVGMVKDLYIKYSKVKELFDQADNVLNFPISKLILEGPKEDLDQTINTQPSIFSFFSNSETILFLPLILK